MDQYVVKTYTGLEKILAQELKNIHAHNINIEKRAVSFTGTPKIMYRANFECRTALKVLKTISDFTISEAKDLYKKAMDIAWEDYIPDEHTFSIENDIISDHFDNTMYGALLVKDAIVDRIRDKRGNRPNVNRKNADIQFTVFIRNEEVTLFLNTSGPSLHKRSYKKYGGIAPLSEVLAAGLILLSGWDPTTPFLNPMCGSGTFLVEAQRIAQNIPPQIHRKFFCFKKSPDFDEDRWELILKGSKMRIDRRPPTIIGFDNSREAVNGTKANTMKAGSFKSCQIYNFDFFKYKPTVDSGTVLLNPPYNKRLPLKDNLRFYKRINSTLKQFYKGFNVWLICPHEISLRQAGFKTEKEMTVYNGPIRCRFAKIDCG
ncbi:THUMP domain-containing class I SAM-dependent RNA methyltransferase [Membranihabitans maritimus]|uniref:THUMP domain-containing class I SAM-dependent RNA methyltransferase n=1 Tax=Membranihabitans maritimus TaxID=2904244 RepID=UPI001F2F140A|nr:THUMP domain-containing protein [Membranihabitans maritimus]